MVAHLRVLGRLLALAVVLTSVNGDEADVEGGKKLRGVADRHFRAAQYTEVRNHALDFLHVPSEAAPRHVPFVQAIQIYGKSLEKDATARTYYQVCAPCSWVLRLHGDTCPPPLVDSYLPPRVCSDTKRT
jgi:hypothetical protein